MRRMLSTLALLALLSASLAAQPPVRLYAPGATGTIALNGASVTLDTGSVSTIAMQLTGTFSGTIALQCTLNGSTYQAVTLTPTNGSTQVTSVTGTGIWVASIAGCVTVRATATAWTSGTANVSLITTSSGGASGGGGAGGGGSVTQGTSPWVIQEASPIHAIIDSGGGGGTQYTEGDTDTTIVGTALMMEGAANALIAAPGTAANGLLVDVSRVTGTVTTTANAGTNLNTSALLTTAAHDAVFGTAGTADTQVMSVQGIASMTPLLATVSGTIACSNCTGTAPTIVDDAAFAIATDAVAPVGYLFDDVTPDSVNEGDAGLARMSANRVPYSTIRDAAGNERGANVNASNQLAIAGPVTNAGTFVTQENGALLTAAQLIDNPVGSLAAGAAGTSSYAVGGVYNSTPITLSNGQQSAMQFDANGYAKVNIAAGSSAGPSDTEDNSIATGQTVGLNVALNYVLNAAGTAWIRATVADATADAAALTTGPQLMGYGSAAGPAAMSADGDATPIWTDLFGRIHVAGEALEDAASSDGLTGMRIFAIRDDTLDARSGTEGDFEWFHTNANGALWVAPISGGTEDSAETANGNLAMAGSVRRDVAASSAGTTGDNATLNTNANGALWVSMLDPCSAGTKVFVSINQTAGAQLVTGTASNRTYLCHVNLVTATAQNIALVAGTGTVCATSTVGLMGGATAATGWNFAANGGIAAGGGQSSITKSTVNADNVCLFQSGSGQISGNISYVVAP